MHKKQVFLAGLILMGISFAFGITLRMTSSTSSINSTMPQAFSAKWNILHQEVKDETRPISISPFINQSTFDMGWQVYRTHRSIACEGARGGVVNHHALALDLLVHFFAEAQRCRPDVRTVIIISPDHYLVGTSPITTHGLSYLTYGKTVEVDEAHVTSLQRSISSLTSDPALFIQEHGVGVLVPFIARVWPEAKIVPLVVRSDLDRSISNQFAEWLREQSKDPQVFILVSSDMSHYLDEATALKNDGRTRRAFHQNDEAFFWNAKDGFTDNGRGLSSVVRALQSKAWIEQEHGISTLYQGSPGFTTSYLTGFWK